MESELERQKRANVELEAWVRDLMEENRYLRARAAGRTEPEPIPPVHAADPALA